jgi:Family of unknown function (DUF6541)
VSALAQWREGSTRATALTVAGALICVVAVVVIPINVVRALFAVPLCLVLPGYAISRAAFAGNSLSGLQALLLTPALSLAALALGSVLLNLIPDGLTLAGWTCLLLVIVLGCCAVALRRERHDASTRVPMRRPRVRPVDALLLAVAMIVAGGAFALAKTPLSAPNAIGFTQMWMFSSGTPSAPAVRIGVRSVEKRAATFRLVVTTGTGRPSVVFSHLRLGPGDEVRVNVPLKRLRSLQSIVAANLFIDGGRSVYRTTTALVTADLSEITPPAPPHPAHRRATGRPGARRGTGRAGARRGAARARRGARP